MRTLRYSINVTLDGCVSHEAGLPPDEESMRYWTDAMAEADALLYGRVTYEMMESAWREPALGGAWPEWMAEHDIPFAQAIHRTHKHVVSSTLDEVDWNAELVRGDLRTAVEELKAQPGGVLSTGGVTLPGRSRSSGSSTSTSSSCSRSSPATGRRCSPGCPRACSSSSWTGGPSAPEPSR